MRKCYSSKLLLMLLFFLAVNNNNFAQSIANYAFSFSNTGSLEDMSSGTTDLLATGTYNDDVASAVANIGFPFTFMGTTFTQFSVNSNGQLRFGSIVTAGGSQTPSANVSLLAPIGGDNAIKASGKVHFKVTGTAPNRFFTVEWKDLIIPYSTSYAGTGNLVQLVLNESTGAIEYRYGYMYNNATSATSRTIYLSSSNVINTEGSVTVGAAPVFTNSTTLTSNSFAAGAAIANLSSTSDGSRWVYTFTPPPAPSVPSDLSFTSVTASGMTLNWTDNSSNEAGFIISKSTDGINYSFVSTVTANSISYSAAGLAPNTPYYWQVVAFNEGLSSTPLTGSQSTNAPTLTGTKTVGPTGVYSNLTAAFSDITSLGLLGPVTLELQADYLSSTETFPLSVPIVATSINTITIRPAAAGLSISGSATGILNFSGSQNIIIDGRVGGIGSADLILSNASLTGTVIQFINESSNNVIRYCNIKGVNTTSTSGLVLLSTTTGLNGNDNNLFDYCNFSDGLTKPANLIYSVGSTTNSGTYNSNGVISNSNFTNWTGAAIGLAAGNTDWTVTGNSCYQSTAMATYAGTNYGIYVSNSGNNFTITNNKVGGNAPNLSGTWTVAGTTGAYRVVGIYLSAGTTVASNVQGNTISNFSIQSTSGATTLPGVWCGIYLAGGNANIGTTAANTIGSGTGNGSVIVSSSTTGAISFGIGAAGSGITSIVNNIIGSVNVIGSTNSVSHGFVGIQNTAGTTVNISGNIIGSTDPGTTNSINASTVSTNTTAQRVSGIENTSSAAIIISNNTIANLNNAYPTSPGTAIPTMRGISSNSGVGNITGNTIRNLSNANASVSTGTTATTIGILYNSTSTGNHSVSQNNIYSISSSSTAAVSVYGIYYAGATAGTNLVARNNIHSLSSASTGVAVIKGIYVGAGLTTYQNNMIRLGYTADGTSLAGSYDIMGIYDLTGTNNYYFNSVYIGGTVTPITATNTYAFNSAVTTNTRVFQSNIFVNARSNATTGGKHYAITVTGSSPNPVGLNINYNLYQATGTGGFLGRFNAIDIVDLSGWKTAVGQDAFSVNVDPQFLNPTGNSTTGDLHINTSNPTPVEGGGFAVSSITDDFDGQLRSGLTPSDMGADAGNFSPLDLVAPFISYPTILYTGSTPVVVTATITDANSVPVSGIGLPVMYWKLNNNSYTAITGTSIGNNQYTFSIGEGAVAGDSVSYYLVAQDASTQNNVACSPYIGAAGFTFNPPAVSTPPTTPNKFYVTAPSLAGDYTIGTVVFNKLTGKNITFSKSVQKVMVEVPVADENNKKGTQTNTSLKTKLVEVEEVSWIPMENGKKYEGNLYVKKSENPGLNFPKDVNGVYATISAAVADLNIRGISAPARFLLTDTLYSTETLPITVDIINPNVTTSVNTLTIKPNTGVSSVIKGSSTSSVIKLNGADYITLDGSNSNGTSKDLTIVNTATTGTTYVVQVASKGTNAGAVNNTIKNCNIKNGFITSGSYGIFVSGDDNDNLTIQNNTVSKAYVGISANGNSTGVNDNLIISSNSVGSATAVDYIGHDGIMVSNATNANITLNTVYNIITPASTPVGLTLSTGFVASSVTKNNINNLTYTGTSGYGARGMFVNTGNASSNLMISNNFVSAISGDGYTGFGGSSPVGMYFDGITGGLNIYYNSVYMNGNVTYSDATISTAILFYTSTITNIDLRNNIFQNSMNNPNNAGAKNYAIYSTSPAASFTNINYNDYFVSGTQGILGYMGGDKTTLDAWKTATGKDLNSISSDPKFTDFYNLHIPTTVISQVSEAGTTIAGITSDIDGEVRNETTPDLGADEYVYTPPSVIDPTGVTASAISTSQIDVAYTLNGASNNVVIVWNLTGVFTPPTGTPPAVGEPFAGGTLLSNGIVSPQSHTTLNGGTSYYYKLYSFDGSIYSAGVTCNAQTFCAIATVPFAQSFDGTLFPPQCWTLTNAGTGNSWARTTSSTYVGAGVMYYAYNASNAANAWAFTPEFQLVAGKSYRISFYQKVSSSTYAEKLKVTVGSSATPAGQTTVLWDNAGGAGLTNITYILRQADFACTTSGSYYFGFNCYSIADRYNLYVDEISIKEIFPVDLALSQMTQVSGLPTPKMGMDISELPVEIRMDKNIPGGVFDLTVDESGIGVKSSEENNTILLKDKLNILETLNPVNIKVKVQNDGLNSSAYDLNWSVSGIAQPIHNGPSITAGSIDSTVVTYSPTERGTFIALGNLSVTGDEDLTNNSKYLRMRVYPNTFMRGIYDRGDNLVDTYVGWDSLTIAMKAGVRYTASTNIKLEGVDYIYSTETLTSGTFTVQVRGAGTTTTAPGAVLYTKLYNGSEFITGNGDYVHFAFDNDAPVIAAGSDYWITIKAPVGILHPGAVQTKTTGRSFYEQDADTTTWTALSVSSTNYAWIMRSVEIPIPTVKVTALVQGLFNGTKMVSDSITVELRNNTAPFSLVESKIMVLDTSGVGSSMLSAVTNGVPYYIVLKHRNGIETWSDSARSFVNSVLTFNFTTAQNKAFGSNLFLNNGKWCIYNGDVNQDGLVDGSDLSAVDNDSHNFATGYLVTDLNGDGIIDGTDLALTDNNNNAFVEKIVPQGAPGELLVKRVKNKVKPLETKIINTNLKNNQ